MTKIEQPHNPKKKKDGKMYSKKISEIQLKKNQKIII